ncbi:hypothetical protein ANRL4_03553 [Anaerolineae bacterium]|nr:hypothetical protein ANRL4_03553 [Anaerolineae bacterium]
MPYSQQKVIQCWYDVLSDMVKTLRHEADATVALTFRVLGNTYLTYPQMPAPYHHTLKASYKDVLTGGDH